jgi:sec-independent protein translocase protein TatA
MGRLGGGELLLILLIALLIFGPSKLADMGKGLGEGLKNFKKGISGDGSDDEKKPAEAPAPAAPEPPKALTAATPPAAEAPPAVEATAPTGVSSTKPGES